MSTEDVVVVRTESNGYALGVLATDAGVVVYYRDSESSAWTKYAGVAPFANEALARSWIDWQTIMPFRRPS